MMRNGVRQMKRKAQVSADGLAAVFHGEADGAVVEGQAAQAQQAGEGNGTEPAPVDQRTGFGLSLIDAGHVESGADGDGHGER